MGSDFGNVGIEFGMPLSELERMVAFGMTPMEVIVAATNHSAQVCGLDDEVGTLEVGKQADIIVVNDDPLEDIGAMEEVSPVIKNGDILELSE